MDWETFLLAIANEPLLDGPTPPPLNLDDADYQQWTRHVLSAFVKHGPGCFYKLHDDERQWAERAVAEGTFRMAPNEFGLIPASTSWPTTVPVPPPFEEVWLNGVMTYLRAESNRTYDIAPAEAQLEALRKRATQ